MSDINFLHQHDDIDGILPPSQNNIIIGHESVLLFLMQMRKEGRLHHALLFEGEYGIGKATVAFHFAWNILNNQESKFLQPKRDSIVWRQIAQGCHPGFLYVSRRFDSNTKKFKTSISIDDIRDVTHFLTQTSQDGGWRVVIIDSADDMNRNAANAILKTLEEPPAKTLFIVITHSLGRLHPTIRSRCQKVSLRRLRDDEMKQVILRVFPNQSSLDEKTVEIVTQKSHGKPRKAALLICSNGIKIVKTIDNLLKKTIYDPTVAHDLAQTLSLSNTDSQFRQLCDEILDEIHKRAVMLARGGAFTLSQKCAQTWRDIYQETVEMQLFNLDKKQFVTTMLLKAHKVVQECKLFP
ncbi:DNA polymerase III subunit delta prime [Bartonella australis AUST/NH1]|uniref:DNA polymerase III subunit delta prime n=1 Tax=Bartonella australis (strain Aust/NH1) TaxID=1094489 RepID=M1P3Y4_BARAA|nr:DNA polymerase III subunit delta' [Bartonella australis]AGF74525.1 DNA polymerase III subunit delta prime [Bartonella australis AUST/NH1]